MILVDLPEGYVDVEEESAGPTSLSLPLYSRMGAACNIPVFLLVPGHFSVKQDLRELWGGEGDLTVEDEVFKSILCSST